MIAEDPVKLWFLRLFAAFADALIEKLNRRYCRHVLARVLLPNGTNEVVRCDEPSEQGCIVDFCRLHCEALCGCGGEDDGDGGDEDEVEPAWEPKKDEHGREKLEA